MDYKEIYRQKLTTADEAVKVIKSGDFYYATEYRSIVKLLKERDDLFFTPESLTEELEEMCIPQWENEATIYEL